MRAAVFVAAALAVIGVFGAGSRPVHAKRVVNTPSVWSQCPRAATWEKLKPCLQRFGDVKVERSEAKVKLVRVTAKASGWPMPGLYLYAQRGSFWLLAGMWNYGTGAAVEVLGLSMIKSAGRNGFRFDIGTSEPTSVSLDGETALAAIQQSKTAVFCPGPSYACSPIIQSCDVLVGGKAYYTFRGRLKVDGGMVTVTGDRTRAGACAPAEQTRLPFGDDLVD